MPLSDEKLYALCEQYGAAARLWRQKFAGLLPEVYKRGLYKKKGFHSIFEFAKKLAGMTEEHVTRVLHLDERFEDQPILKKMLANGEVSIHKLARVASVVTPENEQFWADQVKLLPKEALETLVRDEKRARENLAKFDSVEQFVPGHKQDEQTTLSQELKRERSRSSEASLNLSPGVQAKLLDLQNRGLDVNTIILELLGEREQKIAIQKEWLANVYEQTGKRYIPVEARNLLKEEYGTKCSIEGCKRESEEIHHTHGAQAPNRASGEERFSLGKNHNPKYLAPLCKGHHQIAHSIDIKVQQARRGMYLPTGI